MADSNTKLLTAEELKLGFQEYWDRGFDGSLVQISKAVACADGYDDLSGPDDGVTAGEVAGTRLPRDAWIEDQHRQYADVRREWTGVIARIDTRMRALEDSKTRAAETLRTWTETHEAFTEYFN